MTKKESKGGPIMQEAALSPLAAWQGFYVLIGTAAATLTGLMFVVITLIAGTHLRKSNDPIAAFSTPNVLHFCAALLATAILSAPWQALWHASLLLGLGGLWGVVYVIIVARRLRRQTDYQSVLEDWVWHTILPLICYVIFVVAAIVLPTNPVPALFGIATATVLLLFIGIHNAWDTVTYITVERFQRENKRQD
jgi:hypothetical protein